MYVTSPEHMVIANDNYLLTCYDGTEQQVHIVLYECTANGLNCIPKIIQVEYLGPKPNDGEYSNSWSERNTGCLGIRTLSRGTTVQHLAQSSRACFHGFRFRTRVGGCISQSWAVCLRRSFPSAFF